MELKELVAGRVREVYLPHLLFEQAVLRVYIRQQRVKRVKVPQRLQLVVQVVGDAGLVLVCGVHVGRQSGDV